MRSGVVTWGYNHLVWYSRRCTVSVSKERRGFCRVRPEAIITIDPEGISARMTKELFRDLATKAWIENTPTGRVGQPEETARGALFLASDDTSFSTGSLLVLDGGYTAI